MNTKICDLCLWESGKTTILHPTNWKSWHWSHSLARTIHFCVHHDIAFAKKQTYEDYRIMVQKIDNIAAKQLGW